MSQRHPLAQALPQDRLAARRMADVLLELRDGATMATATLQQAGFTPMLRNLLKEKNILILDKDTWRGSAALRHGQSQRGWRGPHVRHEIALLLHGSKPVALLGTVEDILLGRWLTRAGLLGAIDITACFGKSTTYIFHQIDKAWEARQVEATYRAIAERGAMMAADHHHLGLMFGYDSADIDTFLLTVEQRA